MRMPKRTDIQKILIIGSGPIVIGQACEFDYSGTQACKALRNLGYTIVLVNSNPATIMTDPQIADETYIMPLNLANLTDIIAKTRPDALLPNLGGQSGLNLCEELAKAGVLDRYGVEVIGVQVDAIEKGEDRIAFKETMDALGIEMAKSAPAYSVEEALAIAKELGYPVVVRPAYTMGGAGGGIARDEEELRAIATRGIEASLVGQVLIEESVIGWEELELEVVRDQKGQKITVCFIENIDPMGVHTGDSFCAAPMLTIDQVTQDRLQEYSYKIIDAVEVIGGCNCQFAHDPKTGRIVVIEINPRTSRSSALASKATGFPIAMVSTLLAAGMTLDEIPYYRKGTLDQYSPYGDYVVIKFAKWAFEKFKGAKDELGTQMRAVGEVMSIGKNYKEAMQKAIRSLENGRYGLGFAKNFHELSADELCEMVAVPNSERQFQLYEALRKGVSVEKLHELTHIKAWFLEQMKELVELEEQMLAYKGQALPDALLRQAKLDGFADAYLARILGVSETAIREQREKLGVVEGWDAVHVSGVENACYYYSTYNAADRAPVATDKPKVMVLGGGPNRIGQGIEFDYCCCHAAYTLKDLGFETIMVNCNPETVSTDYDTSDKLYFEPLTMEDVLAIYHKEKPVGIIAQFGGQTPLNLANALEAAGVKILGTSPRSIDLAEDRDEFRQMMDELGVPMPESGMAVNVDEATAIAGRIGYPLMVRPSYVLGGRGMEVVHDHDELVEYMNAAVGVTPERPILIDRFLSHALECEADAISDGDKVFVPAVMEHIELAGIHSGDSACVLPPIQISQKHINTINAYTEAIAKKLDVVGLMNMQYAICDGIVYVIEANPRASRTVPLVSKVCNINMVRTAVELIMRPYTHRANPLDTLKHRLIPHYGVKEAVLPFSTFREVDPVLGPEMRSTGEVLGLSKNFGIAYYKAQEATQLILPLSGTVFISVNDESKEEAGIIAERFYRMGFNLAATKGTAAHFRALGLPVKEIAKLGEGHPDLIDELENGKIDLIINTPSGKQGRLDGQYIRSAAIKHRICYATTMAAAKAMCEGIRAVLEYDGNIPVRSLQEYHAGIRDRQPMDD